MKKQQTESQQTEFTVKKKLTTNQKIMIGGFGVLAVAVVVVGLLIYMAMNKEEAEPTGNYVIDDSNYEDIIGEMNDKLQDGMYEVTMNAVWNFDNGEAASSDAYVANAETNHTPVYFEVFLKDTNELIYTSSVLPVGTKLKELKLDKSLEKGSYDAICKYNLLDEGGEVASSVSIAIELEVAN